MKKFNVLVKEKKLAKYDFSGEFLTKQKGKFVFSEKHSNSIFVADDNVKPKKELTEQFGSHLQNVLSICSAAKNKPSIVVINPLLKKDQILTTLGENYKQLKNESEFELLNTMSSIYFSSSNHDKMLEQIFSLRSNDIPKNNLYVILNLTSTKDYKEPIKQLHTYLTIAISRNIYFMVFVGDKQLFIKNYSPETYDTVLGNCTVKFVCNETNITSIEQFRLPTINY